MPDFSAAGAFDTALPVLVVEDRVHTAERLRLAVESRPRLTVCGVAYDVETGLRLLAEHRPRVLVTDLGLPDGSGIEVIKAARAADWQCDSLIVTVFGDEDRVMQAIRAGALGYILKSDPIERIGRAVEDLLAGGSPMSPKVARLILQAREAGSLSADDMSSEQLTPRELDVLRLVSRGKKRREVADALSISIGTVGTHINSIYTKMGVRSNIEAVVKAAGSGLI